MRAFYHGVRQLEGIFRSKVTILPNNRQNFLKNSMTLNCLGASDKAIKS